MKWIVHIVSNRTSIFTSLYLKHLNMCISNNMLLKRTVLCWAIMQWVVLLSILSRSLKSRMLLILLHLTIPCHILPIILRPLLKLNLTIPCHILPVILRPLLEKCVLDYLIEYLINYVLNKCV
jgi:hypothetical protein